MGRAPGCSRCTLLLLVRCRWRADGEGLTRQFIWQEPKKGLMPSAAHCTQRQHLTTHPGDLLCLTTDMSLAGVPYCDAFRVQTFWRVGDTAAGAALVAGGGVRDGEAAVSLFTDTAVYRPALLAALCSRPRVDTVPCKTLCRSMTTYSQGTCMVPLPCRWCQHQGHPLGCAR
jgi:hypothetical protein